MTIQKKSQRKWLYLDEQDLVRLSKLVEAVGTLNDAVVLSALASAGLKACEGLGYRLPLPLKFEVAEGVEPEKPLTKIRR